MTIAVQTAPAERRALVMEKLAEKPDGVLEAVAASSGVSTQFVLECIPEGERAFAGADRFAEIWQDIGAWGEILFVVHNGDLVLECSGPLPGGSLGHGYFNFHGESALGGHLKADAVKSIYFVDRKFHGRRSCSVQFFGQGGEAVFKIFVRRNKSREMLPEQLAAFEALMRRCGTPERA